MKRLGWRILVLVSLAGCREPGSLRSGPPENPRDASALSVHRLPQRPYGGVQPAPAVYGSPSISYHGGPVILAQKVAVIYWSARTIYNGGPAPGTTGPGANDGSLVGFFLNHLGGSPYYGINTTYYNASGTHVQNSVTYTQYWASNTGAPANGSNVSQTAVQNKVVAGFNSGALTYDATTVYLVFTDSAVSQGTLPCPAHTYFFWGTNVVKLGLMARVLDFPGCSVGATLTPNDDPFADDEISIIAHEVEETNTDPQGNAWYDDYQGQRYENADKCKDDFGTTYQTPNLATANMNLGGKDFLVQQNWEIGTYQGCATKSALVTLTLSPKPLSVCLNGSSPIGANTTDEIGNYWSAGTVSWASSDPSIAPVTPNGSRNANVAGNAAGTATITGTLDGLSDASTATVGTCLAPPTSCTLEYIPYPHYLHVQWANGDASASTEVWIMQNAGSWQLIKTASPGTTGEFHVVGPGLWDARVRHVKPGYLPSDYCNTNGVTV